MNVKFKERGLEPPKNFEIDVCANAIINIFLCICERLKFKLDHNRES